MIFLNVERHKKTKHFPKEENPQNKLGTGNKYTYYVQIRIAALNDSSSEVDGDDFRAKTVGTREAEVCINIQIKNVIGFDELADC